MKKQLCISPLLVFVCGGILGMEPQDAGTGFDANDRTCQWWGWCLCDGCWDACGSAGRVWLARFVHRYTRSCRRDRRRHLAYRSDTTITGVGSEQLIGTIDPATIIGNFFAIMCSALLSLLWRKNDPEFSGQGQLVKVGGTDDMADALKEDNSPIDVKLMGAGVLTACTLFIAGGLRSIYRIPWTCIDDRIGLFVEIFERCTERAAQLKTIISLFLFRSH